ncbi:mitogen-activated protein kinase 14-like [Dysidea avara]|uniref:mitogen-activated protein kinase 14-like n=1 Tax=Dysidea avara TaxID=196820 RepID=UPI00333228BA
MAQAKPGFYQVVLSENETVWEVPVKYQNLAHIGTGAFGDVCSAYDAEFNAKVALKKLSRPFQSPTHAKRAYREIKLLKMIDHENVICLLDVFTSNYGYDDFDDIYLVSQLMESDLSEVIRTQKLTDEHVQFLIYQILRGLKYLHSAGIVHRDLKLSNIAVNEDCDLRILDFGLARAMDKEMTGYVTTRWYRAPEIILSWMKYDSKVDMWSVGCIVAELLTGQVLFKGNDHIDQLHRIMQLLGKPDAKLLEKITPDARKYVESIREEYMKRNFSDYFIGANPKAINFLEMLLTMDPVDRLSAEEALAHPYVAKFSDPSDEPISKVMYNGEFEVKQADVDWWKRLVFEEVTTFVQQPDLYQQKLGFDCRQSGPVTFQ